MIILIIKIHKHYFINYFINDKIETHIHFPPYKGDNLFKLLVLPNKYKQFIHLEDFTEENKSAFPYFKSLYNIGEESSEN